MLAVVDPVDDTYRRQMNRQVTVQESRHKLARDICHPSLVFAGPICRKRSGSLRTRMSFVDEVSETAQPARTSRRFFDPPDRDQAVEDVDDELGRGAWPRTRLVSRPSAPCAYQVTDAQRWLGPPVSRCLR